MEDISPTKISTVNDSEAHCVVACCCHLITCQCSDGTVQCKLLLNQGWHHQNHLLQWTWHCYGRDTAINSTSFKLFITINSNLLAAINSTSVTTVQYCHKWLHNLYEPHILVLFFEFHFIVFSLSWTIIVVHSRDDKGVGMALEIKISKNQPDNNGAVLVW